MDFFASQERARKRTGWLVVAFLTAVLGIVLSIYGVLAFFARTSAIQDQQARRVYPVVDPGWWFPELFAASLFGVTLIVSAGSGFKLLWLRGGGASVAESMGGILLQPTTTDFKEKRLLNVVEEMALASGVPVPPVYVMREEKRINAFAAGFRPDHAVIGITQGAIDAFSRSELQGVIAHEFSHILNGDMKLNMKLIGLLQGILLIYLIGRVILRVGAYSGGNDRKNGALPLVVGLVMMVIGLIGYFVGRLIKMAVSRQREYLADASAVQFTRSPEGLSDALKRIGAYADGSRIQNPKAEEISHMFFASSMAGGWNSLFATHPPLVNRIRVLEPDFDGDFEKVRERLERRDAAMAPPEKTEGIEEKKLHDWLIKMAMLSTIDSGKVMASIGTPATEHVSAARTFLAGLPEALKSQCHDPFGARAVVYRLLLDERPELRAQQIEALRSAADPQVFAVVESLVSTLTTLPMSARLPVLDLCMPALKQLSDQQREAFVANMDALIGADQRVTLMEYSLRRILLHGLGEDAAYAGGKRMENHLAILSILSMLAARGHEDSTVADGAFARAVDAVRPYLPDQPAIRSAANLTEFDRALTSLSDAAPDLKKQLMVACMTCLSFDQTLTTEEFELFRCIAAALHCPVPLMMGLNEPAIPSA